MRWQPIAVQLFQLHLVERGNLPPHPEGALAEISASSRSPDVRAESDSSTSASTSQEEPCEY